MKPIEIVCHKGANEYAPENSYAAAQRCIDWDIDYVEIDVRTSKDGVFYRFTYLPFGNHRFGILQTIV